jgi:hypothetical protein
MGRANARPMTGSQGPIDDMDAIVDYLVNIRGAN